MRDIVAKYDPMVLRFFMLSAHYRSPLNFSAELMEAAANGLDRIRTAVSTLAFKAQNAEVAELSDAEKSFWKRRRHMRINSIRQWMTISTRRMLWQLFSSW